MLPLCFPTMAGGQLDAPATSLVGDPVPPIFLPAFPCACYEWRGIGNGLQQARGHPAK